MSHMKVTLIACGVVLAIVATIFGALYLADKTSLTSTQNKACQSGRHTAHKVTIKNNKVTPEHTEAHYCDTLTITNLDNNQRLIGFGVHNKHTSYDGIEQRFLSKNEHLTVTLIQTGNFRFHDHDHDEVQGTFTVTRQ